MTTTITTLDLFNLAEAIECTVTYHHGGAKGVYHHPSRTISLRNSLTDRQLRCTLAHELGHAIRGDAPVSGVFCDHIERRADEFAARLLISPIEYQLAEALHGGHIGGIAYELEVTPHLVEVWRGMYRKIAL
ncbi:ImmA/IrrE family metallo-endopeptidase [Corynebacterium kutscheri]|uniref:ImmA/IrrE family metallo-endopeptidase n=1 Tax=Corynebacterium kutscheri TaxID=35755 RepID=UPI0037BEA2D6